MLKKDLQEDRTEAELAQEFKEYLSLIGEEISDPLREQVKKQSDYGNQILKAIEKLEYELQEDIKLSVHNSLQNLSDQVNTINSDQHTSIDKKLNEIHENLQNQIENYEKKTTQRLMTHRRIETIFLFIIIALVYLINN